MVKRSGALFLILPLVICGIAGCGVTTDTNTAAMQGASANEILTTDAVDQEKTVITVRVETDAEQTSNLESFLEANFPDVDFVMVHHGGTDSEYNLRENLVNGLECDFIVSSSLNNIADIAADYLLDLSSQDFVNSYYMSAVDSCASPDGKLYYLPGPSSVYGIVYDKTMFEENGWSVPHSYTEFVELINTIREANVPVTYPDDDEGKNVLTTVEPFQPTLMYQDMFQIVFNTYGFDEVYSGLDNYNWLTEYQNGEVSMAGHMEPAVESFQKLFDDGILSVDDWDVQPGIRTRMLYVYHSTAMTIECQNAITYNQTYVDRYSETAEYHEVAMMPFWTSDEDGSDYLYSIPGYYMAINKQACEESDEKKELLLEIYAFISTVEGQQQLIGDTVQISNVMGVPIDDSSFCDEIRDTIERGQLISTFTLVAGDNNNLVESQLHTSAPDLINGTISVNDWLSAADQVRDDFLAGTSDEGTVYGQAETTLTKLESAYTVAQMYQEMTGADVGIALGGVWRKGTDGYIYQGDITDDSLGCITPDKESTSDENPMEGTIVTSAMTGAQILDILNNGTGPDDNDQTGAYYVAYGLTVKFNPWGDEGNRVLSCTTADGKEIDADATYQVAYFYGSLPAGSEEPESSLGQSWQDSFIEWLARQDGVIKQPAMTLELEYGEAELE